MCVCVCVRIISTNLNMEICTKQIMHSLVIIMVSKLYVRLLSLSVKAYNGQALGSIRLFQCIRIYAGRYV